MEKIEALKMRVESSLMDLLKFTGYIILLAILLTIGISALIIVPTMIGGGTFADGVAELLSIDFTTPGNKVGIGLGLILGLFILCIIVVIVALLLFDIALRLYLKANKA